MERLKPLIWIGSSREDLKTFPELVQKHIGFALKVAQVCEKHPDAKPLRGFGSANVLEVIEDHRGDTYRAVYTVRFQEAIFVLHCFQKKSKRGIATDRRDIELVSTRLRRADELRRHRIA